jgi:hypothetical protein
MPFIVRPDDPFPKPGSPFLLIRPEAGGHGLQLTCSSEPFPPWLWPDQ